MGHRQEELFQRWRFFQFDDTIDAINYYILWLNSMCLY